MKVSIIIPVYQVESYLDDCISSVVKQSYPDLDIILVDDGSTDGSPQLCDSWARKDHRIRVIHQQNQGLSGARNAGLGIAKGDYVYFLDGDDEIVESCIEQFVASLKTQTWDVVQANFKIIPAGPYAMLSKQQVDRAVWDVNIAQELVCSNFYMTAANKLYRKQFLDDHHLRFLNGTNHEDVLWTFEIACLASSLYIFGDALYVYKVREGSIMTGMAGDDKVKHMTVVATGMVSFLQQHRCDNPYAIQYFLEWLYLILFQVYTSPHPLDSKASYAEIRSVMRRLGKSNVFSLFRHGKKRILKDFHWLLPEILGEYYIKTLIKTKYSVR